MHSSLCILFTILMDVSFVLAQGLLPDCPPCDCLSASLSSSPNVKVETPRGEVPISLPGDLRTPREAFGYLRNKLSDADVYKYVAVETLKQFDRVIDDSVEVSSRFAVLAELIATHLLDVVLPGSSKVIDGLKFLLTVIRSSHVERRSFSALLDPEIQKALVDGVAQMLREYEDEVPGCIRDVVLPQSRFSINNFVFREGACPVKYELPPDESVHLTDIRIRVPVDFTRIARKEVLVRGPYFVTFGERYSIMMTHGFDDEGSSAIRKLVYLYHQVILEKNISTYNVVDNLNTEDLSMLSGDKYAMCLQRNLFRKMDLASLKFFTGSYINYLPRTFSKGQIGVKRLQCHPPPPRDGCTSLHCDASYRYFELLNKIDTLNPVNFSLRYSGHGRARRHHHKRKGNVVPDHGSSLGYRLGKVWLLEPLLF